jgi:hypothetical protein
MKIIFDIHLVNVEQDDVLVKIHVFVETVVVRNEFIPSLVVDAGLEEDVLEPWYVWFTTRQRQWGDFNLLAHVVMFQNHADVWVNLKSLLMGRRSIHCAYFVTSRW